MADQAYTLKDLVSDNPLTQSAFNVMFDGATVNDVEARL
jgi:hypothetical protein